MHLLKSIWFKLSVGAAACLLLAILLLYAFCPKPELVNFTAYSKAYFDRNGQLLRLTLAGDERYRLFEPLENISPDLINATLLYEDQDYYQHHGVDLSAIIRAFWSTYIVQQRRIGASTITMQVARLRWNIRSNTVLGKLAQIIRAIQLNRHYSKQEILQTYLNLAPYGRNIEGIGAASLVYFNKRADQLSLPEVLTLAVIPQNPNKRNPTNKAGYQNLLQARNNLMQRWFEHHPEDINKQKHFELPLHIRPLQELPFLAPHFVHYMNSITSRWESGRITTSLDKHKQLQLEKIVKGYVASRAKVGIRNASVLLLNYKTMAIEAMVGSVDFNNDEVFGQVNGVLARRSPGSALKPFVYALALDESLIHPMTLLKDSPTRYGGFTPENYDKQFLGPVLARDALINSRNVPAVELQSMLKQKSLYKLLTESGVEHLKAETFYGLALALGGGEITMLELAQLYAMLANRGEHREAVALAKQRNPAVGSKVLLSPEASYLVLDMLKDNPPPKQLDASLQYNRKTDVAWKTGTSWAFRDAWAIGISGPYVLAVWVGNFDGSGNDAFIGRTAAGPLMFSIFDAVQSTQGWTIENNLRTADLNLKRVEMCSNTGNLPGKYCPSTEWSWFIPGVSPITVSNIYRAIPIDRKTGLRACWHNPERSDLKVYQFWPSDFMAIFRQAGLSLKTPPAYLPGCSLNQKSTSGQQPLITSPQTNIEYIVRTGVEGGGQIPLSATTDPDVTKVFWFIDDRYIGSTKPSETFLWLADSGRHQARAVDDSGRSSSVVFDVSSSE